MRQERGVQCARLLKARGDPGSDGRKSYSAKHLVGRADGFVFVPWFLVLASFWIYLFWARPRAMDGSDARVLWNAPYRRNPHALVMFGSLLIILYSFTLFLRRRFLFGRVARSWTIAIAILFIVLAAATGVEALATYASSFL